MSRIPEEIYIKINPVDIDMLTKFIEAYDNLGIVTTVRQTEGLVKVRGTSETYPDLIKILEHLPFTIEWLD